MLRSIHEERRRGAMLPLMAFMMLGLIALLALAIDIGMIAIARSQCQNAADSAATAGARTLNGNVAANYNMAAVPGKSVGAVVANTILAKNFSGDPNNVTKLSDYQYQSGQALIEIGTYAYKYDDGNSKNEGFKLEFPRTDFTEPYTAVRATVQNSGSVFFGKLLGWTKYDTNAVAVAVHRPRDVIIIMDLSGSMRFQSLPGIPMNGSLAAPSWQNRPRVKSMNPESVFPQFGHYSNVAAAALQGSISYSTGTEMVDPANISTTTNSGPPILEYFFQNDAGVAPGAGNRAFARAPDAQDKAPGGYNYLKTNGNTGAGYAATVSDIVGKTTWDQTWEQQGYDAYQSAKPVFYTEGPGYWGKTFFIWPPDPRGSSTDANDPKNHADNGAKDWRQRFFFKYNTLTKKLAWLDHNNILFNPAGKPSTNSLLNPTPIIRTPAAVTTVIENGAATSYSYRINYAAIFHWLRNQDPKPFPNMLRAGRIRYYDSIPDPSDTTLNNRFWTTYPLANINERFWKDYVDFVLGLKGTGAGTYTNVQNNVPISARIGNGDYFPWGAVKVSQKPDPYTAAADQTGTINNNSGYAKGYNSTIAVKGLMSLPEVGDMVYIGADTTLYRVAKVNSINSITLDLPLSNAAVQGALVKFIRERFMDYADTIYRPRHQFWFGPMTFVDWLGNYNTNHFWWPGNVPEAQCWACKIGINTAIDDIKNNHPGDFIGLTFFSSPRYSASGAGHYNQAVVPLGRNYQQLKDSLWFPPSTVTGTATEITPYDGDFDNVPRAVGGTCPGMGFMIAYNLLSSSTANLRFYSQPQPQYRGNAGGLGRKGAQRIIIFETDGAPNVRAAAGMGGSGSDSYYKIRLMNPANPKSGSNVEWPFGGLYADQDVYNVVDQICKLETVSPPGYSTNRRKAMVYPLGYGTLFDPANPSVAQTDALSFLQNVAYRGNTATNTNPGSFPDSRRIYGTNQQRIDRIRNAFTDIMQNGVQVSLIE